MSATRGRPPKAPKLRAIDGGAGHRPAKKGSPRPKRKSSRPLPAPKGLSTEERKKWRSMAKLLAREGLSSPMIADTLERYVRVWHQAEQIAAEISGPADMVQKTQSGYTQVSGAQSVLMALRKELLQLGDRLGLSPLALVRLGGGGSATTDDPLGDVMSRTEARQQA